DPVAVPSLHGAVALCQKPIDPQIVARACSAEMTGPAGGVRSATRSPYRRSTAPWPSARSRSTRRSSRAPVRLR
ncbi:hypothetical protein CTI14_70240, partial [Methylobacterium radiotolerans]